MTLARQHLSPHSDDRDEQRRPPGLGRSAPGDANAPGCRTCGLDEAEHGPHLIHRHLPTPSTRPAGLLPETGPSHLRPEGHDVVVHAEALRPPMSWRGHLEQAVASLATSTGADHLGVAVVGDAGWRPLLASDDVAGRADHLHDRCGEGPGLHAVRLGRSVHSHDLHVEARWSRWCGTVVDELRLGAALMVCLRSRGRRIGTVNLYSDTRGGLADVDVAELHALAVPLSTLVLEARAERRLPPDGTTQAARHLRQEPSSRQAS